MRGDEKEEEDEEKEKNISNADLGVYEEKYIIS